MNVVFMTMLLVAGEAPSVEAEYAVPYYVDPVVGIQPGRPGPRNKTGVPHYKAWLFRYTIRNGTTYLPAYDYRTQFDYSWHSRMLKYRLAHHARYHAVPGPESYENMREEVPSPTATEAIQKQPAKQGVRPIDHQRLIHND